MFVSLQATSCLLLVLVDPETGMTGLAHLDGAGQAEQAGRAVRAGPGRLLASLLTGSPAMVCGVVRQLQRDKLRQYHLQVVVAGRGGGVEVGGGVVWRGGTLHRGPDLDIRSCRLHSDRGRDLLSLHCSLTGHIVIPPFRYPPGCPQAAQWRHRSDQALPSQSIDSFPHCNALSKFLLDRCSTTPAAESARFLPALRAALARLESDPEPEVEFVTHATD